MYFVKQSLAVAASAISNSAAVPPVSTVTTGTTVGLTVGQPILGAGFPTGTTVASIVNGTQFTTSSPYSGTLPLAGAVPLIADVANNWKVYTTVSDPTTGAPLYPLPTPLAGAWAPNGLLSFGANGRYAAFTPIAPSATTSISLTPAGAAAETIPFDFASSTQFGALFGVTKLTQDGFTSGQLSGFNIGADGIILGRYSNGVSKPLGQVALATFPNMQGLQPLGSNEWAEASASGSPVVNAPGTGNNGVLQTSATEDSSVDLTAELVNMITAQRVYQANAQTIKTQDAVMQTLVNLR